MKMKVNWRKYFICFALLEIAFVLCGCTSAWITSVSGLLPGILAAVNAAVAFVAALEGKTVPPSVVAAFQKWGQNLSGLISTAQAILAEIQKNATATVLQQFQGVMQAITSNLNSILSDLNVTDSATVAKITGFVQLAIAAATAILSLIPMAVAKLGAPGAELKHYDAMGASATANAQKVMKDTYHAIVTTPTENADVNSALASLPQSI